jgi:hypothetical protein
MELIFVFLVLNMSTSCQLAFSVNNNDLVPLVADSTCPVQYFPYFENSYLAIAASLNGGNVLTHFVAMLQQWLSCFGKINFVAMLQQWLSCFGKINFVAMLQQWLSCFGKINFVAMLQQWLSCFGKINFDSVITYNTYKPCFVEVKSSNDIILSDCRLMPTQQFFSYIMARTS